MKKLLVAALILLCVAPAAARPTLNPNLSCLNGHRLITVPFPHWVPC